MVWASALPVLADPPSLVAIRNVRVVTVSGPTLEKGTVIIRNGLIEAVGADVPVPAGAWIVEGPGLTVYPGLIDALSAWGVPEAAPAAGAAAATAARRTGAPATPATPAVAAPAAAAPARGPEDRPQTQSWLRIADQVSPSDRRLEAARTAGFTTAVTFPRTGLVAGNGAAINLGGERSGDMIVNPSTGLYLTLGSGGFGGGGSGFPGSLFGIMAYYRQLWIDAAYYRQEQDWYAKSPAGKNRPRYDRALEGVLAAPRILLPANTLVQIERMLRFGKELKTPFFLYGLSDGFRAVDLLKASNVPVIINLRWPTKDRDADPEAVESYRDLDRRDKAASTPGLLAKAGVKFAFSADGVETPRAAIQAVKKAMESGLSKEEALRALTLTPAEMYGLHDRLGSLDKGKIANVLVIKGDLFDERPQVQMIFIDGVKYDPAPETPTPAGGPGLNRGGATPPAEDETENR
jgi:hypothetical protein